MKNSVAKKFLKKLRKEKVRIKTLESVLDKIEELISEKITPADLQKYIIEKQCDSIRSARFIKDHLGLDELEFSQYEQPDISKRFIQKEVDFVPTENEFEATINLPNKELQKMGFSRMSMGGFKDPVFPPEDKVFLAFPVEWKDIIPDGFNCNDLNGDKYIWRTDKIQEIPVIDGCFLVGILRDKDGTEFIPTFDIE